MGPVEGENTLLKKFAGVFAHNPDIERFDALVVPSDEGFNGLAQLIFGFEACSVEGLALQEAEHDFQSGSANWPMSA